VSPLANLVVRLERELASSTAEIERADSPSDAAATVTYRLGIRVALTMAKVALHEEETNARRVA
jgi:hypothetical protein